MRLCIFKMLTQKKDKGKHKKLFTARLWIPDITFTNSDMLHKFPMLLIFLNTYMSEHQH